MRACIETDRIQSRQKMSRRRRASYVAYLAVLSFGRLLLGSTGVGRSSGPWVTAFGKSSFVMVYFYVGSVFFFVVVSAGLATAVLDSL